MFSTSSFGRPELMGLSSQRNALRSAYRKGIRNARKAGDALKMEQLMAGANARGLQVTGLSRFEDRRAGDVYAGNQAADQSRVNAELERRAMDGVNKIGNMDSGGSFVEAATGDKLKGRQALYAAMKQAGPKNISDELYAEGERLGLSKAVVDTAASRLTPTIPDDEEEVDPATGKPKKKPTTT